MSIRKMRNIGFAATLLVMAMLIGLLSVSAAAAEPASDMTFTFTEDGVTVSEGSGSGYKISGTSLTINESGVYTVTGAASEGSITVKKGTENVTLILKNLTLSSSTTAPLTVGKSASATVYISGTVTLTDLEDASTEDTNEDFEGAAIKVKSGASLTITGSGVLTADGSACKNGIKGASEATITIESSTVNVKAANNGLASDGELIIKGGTVNVAAGNDGIKSDPDDDDTASKGNLTITGGNITVSAGDDAIKALYDVVIGAEGSASGPVINVTKSYEGIEGARVYLNSGSGNITASDDGVNAATSRAVSEIAIYLNGGTWSVNAGGDGLDAGGDSTANSGGSVYINGGVTTVFGSANGGNSALDYDTKCVYSGGTLLAVGMNGMAQTAQGTGIVFNTNVSSGALISIKEASGAELVSATAPKAANWVYLASDKLTSGSTYTLYLNGKATAAATAGTTTSGGGFGGGMGGNMGGRGGQMPGNGGQRPGNGGQMPGNGGQMPGNGGQMPGNGGQMPGMGGQAPENGQRPEDGETPEKGQRPGDGTGRGGKGRNDAFVPVILEGVGVMSTQLPGEAPSFLFCY